MTDITELRAKAPSPITVAKSPTLRAFLLAGLSPYGQYQADGLGERWIKELRGEG